MAEVVYVIEKIIEKKFYEPRKTWIYLVKWEGFADSDNTWEPEENLLPLGKMLENFNKVWDLKNKIKDARSENFSKKPVVSKVKGLVELGEINAPAKKYEAEPAKRIEKNKILNKETPKKKTEKVEKAPGKTPENVEKVEKPSEKVEKPSEKVEKVGKIGKAEKVEKVGKVEKQEKKDQKKSAGEEETKKPRIEEEKKKDAKPKRKKAVEKVLDELADQEKVKLISKKTLEKSLPLEYPKPDMSKNPFKSCIFSKGSLPTHQACKIIGCRKRNNLIQYAVLYKGLTLPSIVSHSALLNSNPGLLSSYLLESFS